MKIKKNKEPIPDYIYKVRFFNHPHIERDLKKIKKLKNISINQFIVNAVDENIMNELEYDDPIGEYINKCYSIKPKIIKSIHYFTPIIALLLFFQISLLTIYPTIEIFIFFSLLEILVVILIFILARNIGKYRNQIQMEALQIIEMAQDYKEFIKLCNRRLLEPNIIEIKPKDLTFEFEKIITPLGNVIRMKNEQLKKVKRMKLQLPLNTLCVKLAFNTYGFFEIFEPEKMKMSKTPSILW